MIVLFRLNVWPARGEKDSTGAYEGMLCTES